MTSTELFGKLPGWCVIAQKEQLPCELSTFTINCAFSFANK